MDQFWNTPALPSSAAWDRVREGRRSRQTRCDKSGDVHTIALLKEDRDALQRRLEELENVIELLNRNRIE
jgi:hypothetical protein